MNFIQPPEEELAYLRADPLLWEQELDVRPEFASAMERALHLRAGRVYWRSKHDHLYAIELADLGRGRPSMAMVYGHWDRYQPRPPEHEIDADLLAFCIWAAGIGGLDSADIFKVARFGGVTTSWPDGAVLRTAEEHFAGISDFPYEPGYVEVEGLRIAYVEHGAGDPILLLHGEHTWSYLYRRMISPLAQAGRVIAPDLVGFGRSDKPVATNAYSFKSHCRWLRGFVEALDLRNVTLVCHGCSGPLGLRLLADQPERFKRLVAINTVIADGRTPGDALPKRALSDAEARAYRAPFPSREYQTGALLFPRLGPIRPDDPGAYENRMAIERLKTLDIPVLLPWGAEDSISSASEPALRSIFRNVAPPLFLAGVGHFAPEEAGEEIAAHILDWIRNA